MPSGRMVATIDFSGLMSSTCARARAAAKLPMELLDCCIAILGVQELKGDSAGFGALGAHAMSDCLLRVLRHEAFQFTLCALVFEKCRVSSSKRAGEFYPGIGRAHVDDADRPNPRLRWLNAEEGRGLAAVNTPPELPLSGDDEMLVKGIRRDLDSNPLAAPGNHRKHRRSSRDNPKVMLQLWRILFDCRFFRERPRQHELGLENGAGGFHPAIERRSHPVQGGVTDLPLNVDDELAGIGFVPTPIKVFGD